MLRPAAILTGALALVLVVPGVAWAHASFDVQQVPAGSTQDVTLRVPLERDAVNEMVEVLVPAPWTPESCEGADGWACEQSETEDGNSVLTLTRAPDGPGDNETFAVQLTAPQEEGVYSFPTIQTYDDGVEAAWIAESGTDRPAPRIQVGAETTPVELTGEATPHTDTLTDEPTAEATPDASATESQPSPTATTEPSPTAPATTSADETPSEETPAATETAAADDAPEDDGNDLLVVGLVILGVLVVLGGALWFQERQRPSID